MDYEKSEQHYREAVAQMTKVELQDGDHLHTRRGDTVVSILNKDGILGVRLDEDERRKFESRHGPQPFTLDGKPVEEFVAMPESIMHKPQELAMLMLKAYQAAA